MVVSYELIIKLFFKTRALSKTSTTVSGTKTGGRTKPLPKRQNTRSDRDRKRITYMCAALVSTFVICWLPYHSIFLAKIYGIPKTKVGFLFMLSLLVYIKIIY